MIKEVDIKVSPSNINDEEYLNRLVLERVGKLANRVNHIRLYRRSVDARSKFPIYFLKYKVYIDEIYEVPPKSTPSVLIGPTEKNVIIVGAGPAGYFCALQLLKLGIRPIVLDRGKDVRERRRDLKAIQQDGIVSPDSNYCFGEGGAGTYSDGKLYTRSHKRGSIDDVLQLLVEHGANPDIEIDAHPHIGSNKLPIIVSAIRETIEKCGGEVHFGQRVIDLIIESDRIIGVETIVGSRWNGNAVVLATGHSARDIYELLYAKGVSIEAKPFALGVRIEHAQSLIDRIQYNQSEREENLPASSYSVACQVKDYGVFSFCMCPGGLIVPAATAPGELVVNGMSLSRRDSPFANSGFITEISLEELAKHGFDGVFASLDFQKYVEKRMFDAGDGSQKAPAQRVKDFVEKRNSEDLNPTSYIPGIYSAPMHEILPTFVADRLRMGLVEIDRRMKGYLTNEANIIGTESRTSAPIKIPRDNLTLMHGDVKGLFPCGEGAGYAGGILSAAMDGQNVANAIKNYLS